MVSKVVTLEKVTQNMLSFMHKIEHKKEDYQISKKNPIVFPFPLQPQIFIEILVKNALEFATRIEIHACQSTVFCGEFFAVKRLLFRHLDSSNLDASLKKNTVKKKDLKRFQFLHRKIRGFHEKLCLHIFKDANLIAKNKIT